MVGKNYFTTEWSWI